MGDAIVNILKWKNSARLLNVTAHQIFHFFVNNMITARNQLQKSHKMYKFSTSVKCNATGHASLFVRQGKCPSAPLTQRCYKFTKEFENHLNCSKNSPTMKQKRQQCTFRLSGSLLTHYAV